MASKTTPQVPRSVLLAKAIDGKRAEIAAHRQAHADLINSLAEDPTNGATLQAIAATEDGLSRANASLSALEAAAAEATEQEVRERDAAARVATQALRDKTIEALAKRGAQAARVDRAGAEFVAALKEWRECGKQISADAVSVMTARMPNELQRISTAGQVLPHAQGTHMTFAYALGRVMREALAAFDGESAREVVLVNAYLNVDDSTFEKANQLSVEQAKARI